MEIKLDKVSYKIIKDVSLNISGKITCITGKSGCGVSTLLELISGLNKPDNGIIEIGHGYISNDLVKNISFVRKKVGYVFQRSDDYFFRKTVRDELKFSLKDYKGDTDKRTRDSLKTVGLDDSFLDRSPFDLSSGEKELLLIASVLAYNPEVIVLDEPFHDLDFKNRDKMIKLLKMMKNRYKKTIIVGTTDSDVILKLADRVYVLDDGKIVYWGNKYKILKSDYVDKPKLIKFSLMALEKKNINIGFRDDISDLMKDVYRNVK